MAFTLAYYLVHQDDEEYQQQTQAVRDNNFLFPGGLKMPVASELLPFKVLAETMARQMNDDPNEDWGKTTKSMRSAIGNLLLGPADMMPIMGKPFLEQMTNHSFSMDAPLIGKSLQNKSASEQYTDRTTEFFKALAKGSAGVASLWNGEGISPIVLENYLTGFTGRVGQETLNLLRNAESVFGDRAAPKINEVVGIGAFFENPQGNALRADFQDVVEKVTAAKADLKGYMDARDFEGANEYRREHAAELAAYARIVPIQQRLTELSKQWKGGAKTAEDRDRMYKQQSQALKQVMELRKAVGY
jgi:hypothetical protein